MEEWLYKNDFNNRVRYTLGRPGNHPLICYGINPSTAEPGNLDNTLKSVERLAFGNGFDSWIMLNIYPQRATNPKDIHKRVNNEIHQKNMEAMSRLFSSLEKATLWAAWGTLIESRPFLRRCLSEIVSLSNEQQFPWVSIGKVTKKGHPHHPLYVKATTKYQPFDMSNYMRIDW